MTISSKHFTLNFQALTGLKLTHETGANPCMFLAIAVLMIVRFSPVPLTVAEALATEVPDRKSFKTVPFIPNPSDTQRRELERAINLCVETVEREVPGGGLSANVDGGIVNAVGGDRGIFKFWKCMSENGHPLSPINKSGN